ncbi:hypothetical protein K438DRAFT_1630176 [Mycena galopus ATCC 62051]|nr:hypothetical protein K438DRAFT_1630176 [Mycena galopus ATCC 62051]
MELIELNLSPHFHTVLDGWTHVEKACKFEIPAHRLSAKGRPETIGKWIMGA